MQVLSKELNLTGGVWVWLAKMDFETMGLGVVCIFFFSWIAALLVYRLKNFEDAAIPGLRTTN